ncbi:MAG: peptide ABC transporter substrate-binding protein [Planctomycetota bacterium]|jgi:oligopeptide transport system substrate-binding protein
MKLLPFLLALFCFALPAFAQDPETKTDPFSDEWKREFEPEDDSWKSVKQELIFNVGADPETLDPAIMTGVTEHTLALALYEGLATHDPDTLMPRPGVAARWELSKDLLTYTFHFRENARWSNGDPVTAQDFAWSWYRCLTTVDSDYNYLFWYIVGAREFRKETEAAWKEGKPVPTYEQFQESVKIEILDPRTLRVSLEAPCAYFLDLCCFETYMPVHKATVDKHKERFTRPENLVSNGPFLLHDWKPRQNIVMTPNPHYWDAGFVKLKKITALLIDDLDVAFNKFIKKEVHWIRTVPTARLDEAKRLPEYFVTPYLGSYFYRFNCKHEVLGDKRVRMALSLAVNRDSITKDVTRAGQIPATWFCPPVAGYNPPKGIPYDPDRARAILKELGYGEGGKPFPDLTLFYNTSEDHKKVAERISQMWRETLGINVKLQNAEWKVYLKQVELLDYDIARAGWIGDYGDPMTFLDMWVKDGGNNNTGWSNARYDELIRMAMVQGDHEKRLAIFEEAEKILIEDEFPILPIYIYVNQGMKVDGLQGWYETVRDLHPFQYMYFEPE